MKPLGEPIAPGQIEARVRGRGPGWLDARNFTCPSVLQGQVEPLIDGYGAAPLAARAKAGLLRCGPARARSIHRPQKGGGGKTPPTPGPEPEPTVELRHCRNLYSMLSNGRAVVHPRRPIHLVDFG
jgi:hypothetical protein